MSSLPTIDEFVAEVDSYLSAHYPKAKQAKNRNAFVWGEGSDEVHIFREPNPDDDGGALDRDSIVASRALGGRPGLDHRPDRVRRARAARAIPACIRGSRQALSDTR